MTFLPAGRQKPRLRRGAVLAAFAAGLYLSAAVLPAVAQEAPASPSLEDVLARIEAQDKRLAEQEKRLAEQEARLRSQADRLAVYEHAASQADLAQLRGAAAEPHPLNGMAMLGAEPILLASEPAAAQATLPDQPVGEAPKEEKPQAPPAAAAVPEQAGVLTPRGRLAFDATWEYTRASSNRLVFRGVEIITGVQIGVIEADDASRNTLAATFGAKYGLTRRLEVEARVPYLYRNDRVTTLAQRDSLSRTIRTDTAHIGDAEASLRYQLTTGRTGWPILIAGLRAKSNSGLGPFYVKRDEFGVAQELPTGSGFWGTQATVSMLYPSDPVVLYANLGYLHNIPAHVNKTLNGAKVNYVDPGDSISAGFGFGFALNDRFSYSLGYAHNTILATRSKINGVKIKGLDAQVGTLQLGLSFRFTQRLSLTSSVDVGVTDEAPDVRIALRTPLAF